MQSIRLTTTPSQQQFHSNTFTTATTQQHLHSSNHTCLLYCIPPPVDSCFLYITPGFLFCLTATCLVLSCLVLSCLAWSCELLHCSTLPVGWNDLLSYRHLSCLVLSCDILYCDILYCCTLPVRWPDLFSYRHLPCLVVSCDILHCDILYYCTLPESVGWPDLLSVGGAARSHRTGTEGDAGQGKGYIPISSSDTRLILILIPHTIILIPHCSSLHHLIRVPW